MNQTPLLVNTADPAGGRDSCEVLEPPGDCAQAHQSQWLHDLPAHRIGQVRALLEEAVAVLERTRHAFKSPQLAQLRKDISQLLEELSDDPQSGTTPRQ